MVMDIEVSGRKQNEINHMQVRLFRRAWKEWGISENECAEIFDKNDVDGYIAEL